jgi:hypothetical protein
MAEKHEKTMQARMGSVAVRGLGTEYNVLAGNSN